MKKLWITGGGSGIGACLAELYAAKGYEVIISGRTREKLDEVAQNNPNIKPYPLDITDESAISDFLKDCGTPDLAILNAGTYKPGANLETELEDYRKTMEVNYFGTLNCLLPLIAAMRAQKKGKIGVVGSVAGYCGLPRAGGYGPSKAALISLCESIKTELLDTDVKFHLINPGFVKTPLTDQNDFEMPYIISPQEAADEIYKGLEKDAFEIAFPAPFVRRLKIAKLLPYKWFFPLMKKMTS